jgi:hypothetical protein
MVEIDPMDGHIPLHLLDQLAADGGLLEPEQARSIEKHLPDCSHCRERLESIRNQRQDYLKNHPAREAHRQVTQRSQTAGPAWSPLNKRLAFASGILAVLLAVGLVVFLFDRQATDGILIKGETEIGFTVVHRDQQRTHHRTRQVTLQPGDRIHLQPVYPEGHDHLTVFAVEADGSSVRLFARTKTDTRVIPGLEVDDSPGPNHLVVVYSAKEVPARSLAALEKEKELRTVTIRIDKNLPE